MVTLSAVEAIRMVMYAPSTARIRIRGCGSSVAVAGAGTDPSATREAGRTSCHVRATHRCHLDIP